MTTIPEKELRNNVAEVPRRAAAGERFTITVSGRSVAKLGPAAKRRLGQRCPALTGVIRPPAPMMLADDLERFPAELVDRSA